jgi:hypothetical protein
MLTNNHRQKIKNKSKKRYEEESIKEKQHYQKRDRNVWKLLRQQEKDYVL